jgi:hypothetical protein
MLDRILFNPDNRLLGASTGDLSLYGGQTDPAMALREAQSDTALVEDRDAASGGQVAPSPAPGAVTHSNPDFDSADSLSGIGSGTPSSFLITAPSAFSPPTAPTHIGNGSEPAVTILQPVQPVQPIEGAVPQPTGSGSLVPTPETAAPSALAATAPVVEGVQGVDLPDTLVSTPLANVLPVADGAAAIADGLVETAATVTGGTVGVAADLASASLENAGAAVEDVTDLAGGLVPPALSGVEAVVDDSGTATGDLLTATGATAETALDQLAATPAALTGAVSPIAGTAGDALTATVQPTTDSLDGLGGSDPAAGVATLVSLVSVSDMFDLHPVDAPEAQAPIDTGFGMLDSLAADDLLPDPLLGGHDDHAGLGDHASDHPLGL